MIKDIQLTELKLSELKPYANNPRKNDKAAEELVKAIRQVGYVNPIIVDENYEILAGHTRYKALKKLGWTSAPVLIKNDLSEEQKKKYRLLDNKLGELADWDFDLLEEELQGLDFDNFDFDFGLGESFNDTSFIDDLLNENYSTNTVDSDVFSVTFIFDKCDEELIKNYLKKVGKEYVTSKITEEAIQNA